MSDVNYYRQGTSKTYRKHRMTTVEIADLFIAAGWLGKRQPINSALKLVPHLDRGPGIGR